jgi:hypothetical protein
MANKKINQEDLWCEYSDMPSPLSYTQCTDYDSMGNHGRYPKIKKKETVKLKRTIQKIMLWWSFKFQKKRKKGIWDL